jgi:hypothetical protein
LISDIKEPFKLRDGWLLWAVIGLFGAVISIALVGAAMSYLNGEPPEREVRHAICFSRQTFLVRCHLFIDTPYTCDLTLSISLHLQFVCQFFHWKNNMVNHVFPCIGQPKMPNVKVLPMNLFSSVLANFLTCLKPTWT